MAIIQLGTISVDIGSSYLKIVQTSSNGKILKYAVERLPEGSITDMSVQAEDSVATAIKKARKDSKIPRGKCILTMTGKEVIIRHLTLPKLPNDQLRQNVLFEIAGYLPVDAEKYSIDYKIIGTIKEDENELYNVMVTAIHKKTLTQIMDILKAAGLKTYIVDTSENAREKLIQKNIELNSSFDSKDGVAIIDFGGHTTNVTIFHNGRFYANNSINKGSDEITNIIAKGLETDIITAEAIKKNTDFFFSKVENVELKETVLNIIDSMIYDISRVIYYYKTKMKNDGIQRIYISGGAALTNKLSEYLEKHLNLPVYKVAKLIEPLFSENITLPEDLPYILDAYCATLREV